MTPRQDPEETLGNGEALGHEETLGHGETLGNEKALGNVELRAWAAERGTVYQSAGNMVVVQGGVHEYYYPGGEESVRTLSPSAGEECPYPGLRAFGRNEADWFFGREALVHQVLERLELCLADRSPLTVVAPSGTGKSSLLQAGVLPALAAGRLPGSRHWPQLLLTPTADPLAALASGLGALTGADEALVTEAVQAGPGSLGTLVREHLRLPARGRAVLVVDQLEELFTLCRDESARHRFVAALDGLACGRDPAVLAVYGLRADFYGSCAEFPHLRDALVDHQVIVGPMTDDEVRSAVERPALRSGLSVGQELVGTVLRDLRGSARQEGGGYEAGRLPLLAHALRATWLERRGDALTVDSYRDTGGIDGAVAATAENEFGKLSPSERQTARLLFLGLVRIGENGEVTRRRRTRADLLLAAADPQAVPAITERFTRARLLTQGAERENGAVTVEVTHEALLWAWPRLRQDWIGAGKSGIAIRQELEEAALVWERGGRKDTSALHRGTKLDLARTWEADASPEDLTPLVTAFLAASHRHRRRGRRIRSGAVASVTVLALLASVLAVFAFEQSRNALEQRNNAIFDRVTAEADRQRPTNGTLAAQLDLVAYRMRPTPALRTQLMTEAGAVLPTALPGFPGNVYSLAFGPAGQLATGTGKSQVWDTSDPARPVPLVPALGDGDVLAQSVAYSSQGALLARGGADGSLRIFDVSDARHPVALSDSVQASKGAVTSLKFSPDNRTLAFSAFTDTTGDQTGSVQLWSVADPRHPSLLGTVPPVRGQALMSVAFSPDGAVLAVSGSTAAGSSRRTGLLQLWDVSDPARPAVFGSPLTGHTDSVNQVAFGPDKRVMASAGSDSRVLVWDVSDPRQPKVSSTLSLGAAADSVAFSPDARLLATADQSGNVSLWNVGSPSQARAIGPPLRGHTSMVGALAFDSTGRTLASGGGDGRVLLWRLPPTLAVAGGGQSVNAVAVTGDGRLLAVASGTRVTLWDVSDPTRVTPLGALPPFDVTVNAVAFRPGSSGATVLATGAGSMIGGGNNGAVQLWDVSAPARPVAVGPALPGELQPVFTLAFDADGRTLTASSMFSQGAYSGGLHAWDVSDPGRPAALGGELDDRRMPIRGLAAAPGGGYLFAANMFGRLQVWRTGSKAVPAPVSGLNTGQPVWSVGVSPNARLIATGGTGSKVRLWDVSKPQAPTVLGEPLTTGGAVTSVGFTPDGALLASGDTLGQIRLWDLADPARATAYGLPLTGHNGTVWTLWFSSQGEMITGGDDGTVRLWQTDPSRVHGILCASTRTAMTPSLWKEYVSPALPYDPPCGG
ncbi:nSTAND1 domain-containing NTPase [Kitasatospora cineracea]|uniref:nSTAND1 domain-containing NTPase n=1 Tax=Kitasatospora cineracea TaxID=88074 RepID=UPI0033F84B8E